MSGFGPKKFIVNETTLQARPYNNEKIEYGEILVEAENEKQAKELQGIHDALFTASIRASRAGMMETDLYREIYKLRRTIDIAERPLADMIKQEDK